MEFVYEAHSGVRYLVLLAGILAVLVLLRGLIAGAPYGKAARIASASFVGFVHLQILLGVTLVVLGRWYPALMGHLAMMLLAAAAAQLLTVWGKKALDANTAHKLSLAGVVVALLLIAGGIFAIGRSPLESRAFGTPVDAAP
jgi:hypothetical protein